MVKNYNKKEQINAILKSFDEEHFMEYIHDLSKIGSNCDHPTQICIAITAFFDLKLLVELIKEERGLV